MATMATPALDTNAISTIASNTTTESGNSTDSVASTSSSSTPEPKPSDIDGVGLGNDDLYWISKVNSLNISNKGDRKRSQSVSTDSTDSTIKFPNADPTKIVAANPAPNELSRLHPTLSSSAAISKPPLESAGKNLRRVQSSDPHKPSHSSGFAKKAFGFFSKFKKEQNSRPATPPITQTRINQPASVLPTSQPNSPVTPALNTPDKSLPPLSPTDDKQSFLQSTMRKLKSAGSDSATPSATPSSSRVVLNHTIEKPSSDIPEVDNLRVSKVNFALDTFIMDPPQQIPSRKPREGTVKVDEENGVITRNHKCYATATPAPENYKHSVENATQAAYKSAQQVAQAILAERPEKKLNLSRLVRTKSSSNTPTLSTTNSSGLSNLDETTEEEQEEEEEEDEDNKNEDAIACSKFLTEVDIDKKGSARRASDADDGNADDPKKKKKKASRELTDVYTRCCHLREIMPIKATLRQLEGYTDTLPFLRLLNPRPTMIEVLAFSDFISMVPINTIVLNRIDITDEMFRQLILSLGSAAANGLSKLCLKNVNISPDNWKLFCAFLMHNKSLSKLDISLTTLPSASTNFKYYDFEIYDRSKLDWDLFTNVLIKRGGIEELILNRCLIPHEQFDRLIRKGCCIATKRLGVGSSDLQLEDLKSLVAWTSETSFVKEGIDLGGNDLGKNYWLIEDLFSQSSLMCISINSCNLNDAKGMQSVMPESFIRSSQMRFVDISFNPGLFPEFADFLSVSLELFPSLRRIHINNCGLTSQNIITLAEGFAKCKYLFHISLLGNTDINPAAAEALAAAVKTSATITCVEIDEGVIPANIHKRLNHYCMQNMESIVSNAVDEDDYLIDNGEGLANAVKYVVDANQNIKKSDHCVLFADSLTQRAKIVRKKVHKRLEDLIKNHKAGSTKGESSEENNRSFKENLIKFYYLDTTLGRVLNSYDSITGSLTSKRNPLRVIDRAESTAAEANLPVGQAAIAQLAGDKNEYLPKPPTNDAEYDSGEDGDISFLRSAATPTEEDHRRQQQAREEGDFHKITTFIRRTKPNLSPVDASGEQLRQILLHEETDVGTNDSGKEQNKRSSTMSASNTEASHDEDDLGVLIDRLKCMSTEEIQQYVSDRYGLKSSEDGDCAY
ncbi:hypothetical protein DV495_000635 [Geotrichum candidum]|nr:hypothetical protein DV495_000635 [Geotrichum candidum]